MKKSINKKIIYLIGLIVIFLFGFRPNIVLAKLKINIDVLPSFNLNEKVSFKYSISCDRDLKIKYNTYIVCPNYIDSFLDQKEETLKKDKVFSSREDGFLISDLAEPQTCQAVIKINEPATESQVISKNFRINTKASLPIKVITCKDPNCYRQTRVFIKGEAIYLQIKGEEKILKDVQFSANYKTPKFKTILFTISNRKSLLNLTETGTYTIEITARKRDYKDTKTKIEIGIIEKKPEIKIISEPPTLKEGALVKSSDKPTVYVVKEGELLPIVSPSVFKREGYEWKDIKVVPEKVINLHYIGETLK